MPNMDFYNKVSEPTIMGDYDEYLDTMIYLAQERKKALAPKIWEFQVGERVRFNGATKPKYLQGVEGTVRDINRTRIVVDLDERHNRFYKNITVPLSLVEKV